MSDLLGKTSLCAPVVKEKKNSCPRSTSSQAILTASNGLVEPNQTKYLNARVRHRCAHSLGPVDAQLSQELSLKQQEMPAKSSVYEGRKEEKHRVHFVQIPRAVSEDIAACAGATEQHLDPRNYPPHQARTQVHRGISLVESSSEHFIKEKIESSTSNLVKSRERRQSFQGSHLLQSPPILPGIVGRQKADSALLHLQNSFSKTAAHRNFNSSITYAVVNLNDNVVSGKKHNFFGINSCSLHG